MIELLAGIGGMILVSLLTLVLLALVLGAIMVFSDDEQNQDEERHVCDDEWEPWGYKGEPDTEKDPEPESHKEAEARDRADPYADEEEPPTLRTGT